MTTPDIAAPLDIAALVERLETGDLTCINEAAAALTALSAERDALKEALEPFARAAKTEASDRLIIFHAPSSEWPNFCLTMADLRKADATLAALTSKLKGEG